MAFLRLRQNRRLKPMFLGRRTSPQDPSRRHRTTCPRTRSRRARAP